MIYGQRAAQPGLVCLKPRVLAPASRLGKIDGPAARPLHGFRSVESGTESLSDAGPNVFYLGAEEKRDSSLTEGKVHGQYMVHTEQSACLSHSRHRHRLYKHVMWWFTRTPERQKSYWEWRDIHVLSQRSLQNVPDNDSIPAVYKSDLFSLGVNRGGSLLTNTDQAIRRRQSCV